MKYKQNVSTTAQNVAKPSPPSTPPSIPDQTRQQLPVYFSPITPRHPEAKPAPSDINEEKNEVDERYKAFQAFILPARFEPPANKIEVAVPDVSDEVIMEFGSLFDISFYNTPEDFSVPAQAAYRIYKNRPSSSKSRAPWSMFRIILNTCLIMAIHYDDKRKKTKKEYVTGPVFKDFLTLVSHENKSDSSILQTGIPRLEQHVTTFLHVYFRFLESGTNLVCLLYSSDFKRSIQTWKRNLKNEKYLQENKKMLQLMFNLNIHDKPDGWVDLSNLRK